jgi:hypothetical protein
MDDTVFITVHAAAATVAFGAGLLAAPAGRFASVYRAAVVVAVAALVPAVLVDWQTTTPVLRAVFGGLLVLALVMLVRAELAVRNRPARGTAPTAAYLDHVGFTIISLADGFVVVTLFRAGAAPWLVVMVAVGVAGAGHLLLQATKRHLVQPPGIAPADPAPAAAAVR